MSQQLCNEVQRQRHNKQVNYTQDSSFFWKKRRRAALGGIWTHDTHAVCSLDKRSTNWDTTATQLVGVQHNTTQHNTTQHNTTQHKASCIHNVECSMVLHTQCKLKRTQDVTHICTCPSSHEWCFAQMYVKEHKINNAVNPCLIQQQWDRRNECREESEEETLCSIWNVGFT